MGGRAVALLLGRVHMHVRAAPARPLLVGLPATNPSPTPNPKPSPKPSPSSSPILHELRVGLRHARHVLCARHHALDVHVRLAR